VQFELRNEEDDSDDSNGYEEEVEQLIPVVRRSERVRKLDEKYSSPNFRSSLMLTAINDETNLVGEVVEST
jgi:hypothetical protein